MDRTDVIVLIADQKTKDEFGIYRSGTRTEREVFCQVGSITYSEFFEAGKNGLKPEFRFTMFAGDYEGEKTLRYNGLEYAVYRTFQADADNIELYVERRVGVNGKG